jgi:hypothetical protein
MWKNALFAAAAAFCLANRAAAAEGSRLSAPNLQAESAAAAVNATSTLRPARINIAEAALGSGSATKVSASQKPTRLKTSPAREVVTGRPGGTRERKPPTSSRRTASPQAMEDNDRKITFRPVEVVPLKEESRRGPRSQSTAPVGEVQYPVMPSESLASESTAEYEEDYAPIVSAEPQENFAPVISAADMPRPGRVQPAVGDENGAPPDVSLPMAAAQPAVAPAGQPEVKPAAKEPGRLSSIISRGLRLPEFRSRKSSE